MPFTHTHSVITNTTEPSPTTPVPSEWSSKSQKRFVSERAAGDAPHSVNSLELGVHLVGSLVVVLCGDLIELSTLQERDRREEKKKVLKKSVR